MNRLIPAEVWDTITAYISFADFINLKKVFRTFPLELYRGGSNLEYEIEQISSLSPHHKVEKTLLNIVNKSKHILNLNRPLTPLQETLLAIAWRCSYKDLVVRLLCIGADPNARDTLGRSLIFGARTEAQVKLLRDHGADVNSVDLRNCSALHMAANCQIAQSLIDCGSDVNKRDDNGMTPLFYAKSKSMLLLLLENGADPNVSDNLGKSLIFYVNRIDFVDLLLKHGANVNLLDSESKSPLMCCQNAEIAERLLEYSADPNAIDIEGQSALHHTTSLVMINLLLARGADPNQADECGRTPLFFVETIGVAAALVEAGAMVSQCDNSGLLASDYADCDQVKSYLEDLINQNIQIYHTPDTKSIRNLIINLRKDESTFVQSKTELWKFLA